ncbi:hypothetical protein [Amycolatopsis vancoresmycina]|uniref:hypothetical protein n=1 Tax=Amycolatopsis vancoresmycina TaxID=208444 RepID=UPI0012DE39FE|nr:hypothetical protein [Amycolatopsis vancoresmycina]
MFKINLSRVSVGRPAKISGAPQPDGVQRPGRSPLFVTAAAGSTEIITDSDPAVANDRSEYAGRTGRIRTRVRIRRYRTDPPHAE